MQFFLAKYKDHIAKYKDHIAPSDCNLPEDLLKILSDKSFSKVEIIGYSSLYDIGDGDNGIYVRIKDTDKNEKKKEKGILTLEVFGGLRHSEHEEYLLNRSNWKYNSPNEVFWRRLSSATEHGLTAIQKQLIDNNNFILYASYSYRAILFKERPYTFINGKMSKDGSVLTITTKEFGQFSAHTWEKNGAEGVISFFENISKESTGIEEVRKSIKESVNLDICFINITPNRSSTEIQIYDSFGTRKVSSGFIQYHGINFFVELNDKYLSNKDYYTMLGQNGSILSFNIRKTYESGSISVTDGVYKVNTKNFRFEIPDYLDFQKRFLDAYGNTKEAYAELLKLEIGR